jgi:uncharacterized Zn finger protein (UPF0148 family)
MKKNKKQFCPNCGKEMVLAESHERECDESAMEYKMTAEHQLDLISRQIRGAKIKPSVFALL